MENANNEQTFLSKILLAYEIPKSFFEQQGFGYERMEQIFEDLYKSEKASFKDLVLTMKLKKTAQVIDKSNDKVYFEFNKITLNPTLFSSITCDRLKKEINDFGTGKGNLSQYEVVYNCLKILDDSLAKEERLLSKHIGEGISNGDQETILMLVGILFLF